jgi:hypothetical protein
MRISQRYNLIIRNKTAVVVLMMGVLFIGLVQSISSTAHGRSHEINRIFFQPSDGDIQSFALRSDSFSKEIRSGNQNSWCAHLGGEQLTQYQFDGWSSFKFGQSANKHQHPESRFLLLRVIRR